MTSISTIRALSWRDQERLARQGHTCSVYGCGGRVVVEHRYRNSIMPCSGFYYHCHTHQGIGALRSHQVTYTCPSCARTWGSTFYGSPCGYRWLGYLGIWVYEREGFHGCTYGCGYWNTIHGTRQNAHTAHQMPVAARKAVVR